MNDTMPIDSKTIQHIAPVTNSTNKPDRYSLNFCIWQILAYIYITCK